MPPTNSAPAAVALQSASTPARVVPTATRWPQRCRHWPPAWRPARPPFPTRYGSGWVSVCAMTGFAPACRRPAGAAWRRCWASWRAVPTRVMAPACVAHCWTCSHLVGASMQAEAKDVRVDDVYAVIVTYRPELPLLEEAIAAVLPQVGRLLLFDNASGGSAVARW